MKSYANNQGKSSFSLPFFKEFLVFFRFSSNKKKVNIEIHVKALDFRSTQIFGLIHHIQESILKCFSVFFFTHSFRANKGRLSIEEH